MFDNLFGSKPAAPATVAAPAVTYTVDTPEGAAVVQKRLTDLGYLDPGADGKWGGTSRWALDMLAQHEDNKDGLKVLATAKPLPIDAKGTSFVERVVQAMVAKGYFINRVPSTVNIAYIEGHDVDGKKNDNRNNVFNDVRMIFKIDTAGKPQVIAAWDATTEPSRKWTLDPLNSGGAFHIKPGQYKAWSLGMHHGTMEAWIQSDFLDGYRDPHKTFKRDLDHPVHGNDMAINQHGGYDLPHDDMGTSSAGCLVGRAMDGHRKFMSVTKADPRFAANHNYKVMACVLEQGDVDEVR